MLFKNLQFLFFALQPDQFNGVDGRRVWIGTCLPRALAIGVAVSLLLLIASLLVGEISTSICAIAILAHVFALFYGLFLISHSNERVYEEWKMQDEFPDPMARQWLSWWKLRSSLRSGLFRWSVKGTLIIGLVTPSQMSPTKTAAMAALWLGAAWFWLGSERRVRKQMAQLEIDSKGVEAMYADLPLALVEDKANALYVADYWNAPDTNLGLRHTINFHPIFRHAMVKIWCQDLVRMNRTASDLHQATAQVASEPTGVRRRL